MRVIDDFINCETDVRLDGKVAIVTGASSGIGLEVAKNLANRGAKVIIASRNPDRLKAAKNKIIQSSGNSNVVTRTMDFESLKSVRNFANEVQTLEPKLDILINNIGAIGLEDKLTGDNLHLMMQVNYFGAFLLTFLLYPLLKSSAPSRVVNMSSLSLLVGKIEIDHINEVGRYTNLGFYANAKLADVLFSVEMDRRVKDSGVSVFSVDPGMGQSQFFRNHENPFLRNTVDRILLIIGRPLHRVATSPVFVAVDPRLEGKSGKHFRDCKEFYSTWFASDRVLRETLWEESKRLVGITPEEDWERIGVHSKRMRNDV